MKYNRKTIREFFLKLKIMIYYEKKKTFIKLLVVTILCSTCKIATTVTEAVPSSLAIFTNCYSRTTITRTRTNVVLKTCHRWIMVDPSSSHHIPASILHVCTHFTPTSGIATHITPETHIAVATSIFFLYDGTITHLGNSWTFVTWERLN